MIKDIVVNLGRARTIPPPITRISVADTFGAHMPGVAFVYEPVIPGSVIGGIPPELIESQRAETTRRRKAAIARFEQAAKRAGMSSETPHLDASIAGAADLFGRIARRFDLAVVGQADREKCGADGSAGRRRAVRIRPAGDHRAVYPESGPQARSRDGVLGRQPRRHPRHRRRHAVPANGQAGGDRHGRQQGRQERRSPRRRSRPASRPPRAEGRGQADHLAGYRRRPRRSCPTRRIPAPT